MIVLKFCASVSVMFDMRLCSRPSMKMSLKLYDDCFAILKFSKICWLVPIVLFQSHCVY